jgi:hypothetical protein
VTRQQAVPLAHRTKSHGTLSPAEWAQIIAEEAKALHVKMTPKEIAEGVGIISYESSFNADNLVQGPSGHIGAWSEEPSYGSEKDRLDPRASTRAAIRNWASNGKSWWPAWGRWQAEQRPDGQAGSTQWKKYIGLAEHALGLAGAGAAPRASSPAAAAAATAQSSSSSTGGFAEDLMHFGLVAVLVAGGAVMVGLGGARVLGTATRKAS